MGKRNRPAKSNSQKPKRGSRTDKRQVRRAAVRREPDLFDGIEDALLDHPLALLNRVSALVSVFTPPRRMPFEPDPPREVPSLEEFERELLIDPRLESSVVLAVLAAFSEDELSRHRIRAEIANRAHVLPHWLVHLTEARASGRVVEVVHVLGDVDYILVGFLLPGPDGDDDAHELSFLVTVDHNMGTSLADAGPIPATVDETVAAMMREAAEDTEACDLTPADARARIEQALQLAEMTYPPVETDSFPACGPLLRWVLSMLPEGGAGYQRPEWSDADRQELIERFAASPFGAGFDDEEHRSLLDSLLWFGTDYGPGDPLRWSGESVEIVLLDWVPRKIVAEVDFLAKLPELLRAFVRFAHHERGIRARLTDDVLSVIDEYTEEYQEIIRTPRPQGPAALLAAMGVPDAEDALGEAEASEGEVR
jgi:hypothetical protein